MPTFSRSDPPPGGQTAPLSDQDIAAAKRLLLLLIRSVEPEFEMEEPTVPETRSSDRIALLRKARAALYNRKLRRRIFNEGMFGEPAWEMLLILYVMAASGYRLTITALCENAGVSPSTGLRWLEFLQREDLVERRPHPTDRRTFYIELTEHGRHAIELYFSGTR